MLIPIRCWSCGKPIAQVWKEYQERVKKGEDKKKILDSLGLKRYCCRTAFLSQKDVIQTAAKFKKY